MYTVTIEKSALKYINKLDRVAAKRVRDAIDKIASDPKIGKPLTNHFSEYSYRIGDFRILYDRFDQQLVIVVVKILGRGNVYNN